MKAEEQLMDAVLHEHERVGAGEDKEFVDSVKGAVQQKHGKRKKRRKKSHKFVWGGTIGAAAAVLVGGFWLGGAFDPVYSLAMVSEADMSYENSSSIASSSMSSVDTICIERGDGLFENRTILTADNATSTFSVDVDTASYAMVRSRITEGGDVYPEMVRIEEMINYFKYNYRQPDDEHPFSVNVETTDCPWGVDTKLVRIGLQGKELAAQDRVGANLVFLVDTSGSMAAGNKLPLLQRSLVKLMAGLSEKDTISIVTYAGSSGLALAPTRVTEKNKRTIAAVLSDLHANGSTNGEAGIDLAYRTAESVFKKSGVNRVILATDGDFNVGVSSDQELVKLVKRKAESGIELSVLGFGGEFNDSMLESISNDGNGNYFFIDTIKEGHRVLAQNITGTLQTIAKDVKVQAVFNPSAVVSYRLVGYENRMLNNEDFANDKIDAGEIGAGHSVTALYEIKMHDDPKGELMAVKLRYKRPKGEQSILLQKSVPSAVIALQEASQDTKFAASVAMFGMLQRGSQYVKNGGYRQVQLLAKEGVTDRDSEAKQEFIELVEKVIKR